MVRVPAGPFTGAADLETVDELPAIQIDEHWLDQHEVTNQEFKEFVDDGGYDEREHWTEPFFKGGRELLWEEAVGSLLDATGRPGPATWELGTYPDGGNDLPVGGVSWNEAAAYCAFAGKSLPTIYHWIRAAEQAQFSDILRFSNFGADGPAPVGSYPGLGPYGTYDMAGNVREWCWNASEDGSRYILGGGAGDPAYMYGHVATLDPFDRSSIHGFRCARYIEPPGEELLRPVTPTLARSALIPVDDDVFEAYLSMYAYDRAELEAKVELVDESSSHWRVETVSYDAAYGGERVTALVFLPRNAAPPFQTVVWFPGDDVFSRRSRESLASEYLFDFIPRTGRALVYPIYKGMYERIVPNFVPFSRTRNEFRDMMVYWYKDLSRTLDYLETRADIDGERLAYYGFSTGANYGPVFTAIDARFKASVLLAGGFGRRSRRPEVDMVNFAPRSRVPTLMINGQNDFIRPFEPSQLPLFRLLGTPDADKRHARLEGGHIPSDRREIIRETLDWLDRYLGPVTPASNSATH